MVQKSGGKNPPQKKKSPKRKEQKVGEHIENTYSLTAGSEPDQDGFITLPDGTRITDPDEIEAYVQTQNRKDFTQAVVQQIFPRKRLLGRNPRS